MQIIKRGTRSVLRSPLRLLLVVVLLGTSLMFVAAMLALNSSAQDHLAQITGQLGTDVTISQFDGSLSTSQIESAIHTPGVARFAEEVYDQSPNQTLQLPDVQNEVSSFYYVCWGLSASIPLHGRAGYAAQITAGRTFTSSEEDVNVVLMSAIMAQANHLHLGSVLMYNGTPLHVIGLYTTGTAIGDLSLILPLHTAERVLHLGITYLILYASSSSQVPALVNSLLQRLGNTVNITSHANDFAGTLASLTAIQQNSLNALLVAVLASVLVILFTVLLMVRERIQEIAVLKALGASHWQVISQFSIEILDLCLLAALFAVLLLFLVAPFIASAAATLPNSSVTASHPSLSHLPISFTPQALLLLLAVGTALAVLASTLPTLYIARLKPAQVLRSE